MQHTQRSYANERVGRDFVAELLAAMLVFRGVALRIRHRSDLGRHVELLLGRRGGAGLGRDGVRIGGGVEIVEIGLEVEGVERGSVGLGVQNVVDFGFHFEFEGIELLEEGSEGRGERERSTGNERAIRREDGSVCRFLRAS